MLQKVWGRRSAQHPQIRSPDDDDLCYREANCTGISTTCTTVERLAALLRNAGPDEATLHLLLCWFFLAAMILVLGLLTAYFLKRKDVRA